MAQVKEDSRIAPMLNVLVTMRFDQGQLDRLRAVSPEIAVSQADPETADYAQDRRALRGLAAARPRPGARAPLGAAPHGGGERPRGPSALHEDRDPAHDLERRARRHHRGVRGDHAAGPGPPRAAHGGVAGARRLAAGRAALAAVRPRRGAGRDARHHRLREHRARAGAHRQVRLRDDGAGVQARSRAPGRRRLHAARHRRSGRRAARRVARARAARLPAGPVGRGGALRAAHARDARPDRRDGRSPA